MRTLLIATGETHLGNLFNEQSLQVLLAINPLIV